MVSYQNILAGLVVVLFITTTVLSFYVNKYSNENSRNKKLADELLTYTQPRDCPNNCDDEKEQLQNQISSLQTKINTMCDDGSVVMEDGKCVAMKESGSTITALAITLGAVVLFAGGTIYSLTRQRVYTELFTRME